jgi:hypothetical protein
MYKSRQKCCIKYEKNIKISIRILYKPIRYNREKKLKEILTNMTNIEKKEKNLREKLKEKKKIF